MSYTHANEKRPLSCSCCEKIIIQTKDQRQLCEDFVLMDFLLSNQTEMPISFCAECADGIGADDYVAIMEQVKRGWEAEMNGFSWKVVDGSWQLVKCREPWGLSAQERYRQDLFGLTILGIVRKRVAHRVEGSMALKKVWETPEARYCCPEIDYVIGV